MYGLSCGGGNELNVEAEIDTAGEEFECLTRLTSVCALSSQRSTIRTKYEGSISAGSTSRPVAASVMMRRMHGGGVMGLRSLSPKPHMRAL